MVINKIIKLSFLMLGSITGYSISRAIIRGAGLSFAGDGEMAVFAISILLGAILFYFIAAKGISSLSEFFDRLEYIIHNMTLYEIGLSAVGLIAGLIVANLISIPINKLSIVGIPLSIALNLLLGLTGVAVAASKKNDPFPGVHGQKNRPSAKVVDTSVIIDGRIADICRAGFLDGELVVPSFVLDELQHIADSPDPLKRSKGRRGLDVLNILQKELEFVVKVENYPLPEGGEVDTELLKVAKKMDAKVLTIDYNLNKVAAVHKVDVLNINELSNAVKPIAIPGEEMAVQVIKDGKENNQGIGYLDDGTMVVIDGGRRHMGENVTVSVTSVLQTAAGRMIFAKPKQNVERAL